MIDDGVCLGPSARLLIPPARAPLVAMQKQEDGIKNRSH